MSGDKIRLQMLSWKKENGTFFSSLTAGLDGTISAKIKTELTEKASQISKANESIQAVLSTAAAFGHAATGMAGSAFESVGSMEEHILTLAGKDESQTTFNGSINMSMKGSISTSGVLESSVAVTGVSSPTISLMEFDTKNTQLGRGVWNLKTSPVVWLTAAYSHFRLLGQYWQSHNPDLFYEDIYGGHRTLYFPQTTYFYFFDPSSIEMELTPDLFPSSQVEWTQVEAYCVSHAENGVKGTHNFRKAFRTETALLG